MLRDLVDRFAYRYRLWSAESRSDNLAAGEAPPEISPKNEPAWRFIIRFLEMTAGGLFLLWVLYRFAMRTFPSLSDGIPMIFIFLAVVWCGVGLFLMCGELLTKYSKTDDDDKSI
jgi:TRAP-type C4-dicarboxylate transport system permease small subunit